MPEARRALIGGTINLGDYENFKYEIEGIVTSPDDYIALGAFAGGLLLTQAAMAENPAVKDRIRKHVAGVFGLREESLPEVILKKDVPEGAPTAAPAPAPKREEPKPAPDPAPKKEEPKPAPASVPVPKTEPKTEEPKQPPAPKTEGAPAATCEECGAGITEAQKKISLLFTDKTLCKKCMEGSSGGKS